MLRSVGGPTVFKSNGDVVSNSLTLEQRAKRLAKYIESIAGDQPADEFVQIVDDDPALETLSKREVRQSTDALERAVQGSKLSAQDLFHAEAIVHKTKRPSHKIENNKFEPFSGEFRYLTKTLVFARTFSVPSRRLGGSTYLTGRPMAAPGSLLA